MSKIDAVYVRKSSSPQEEQSQLDAIRDCLDRQNITINKDHWYSDTGSRHRPEDRDGFQKLMRLVEEGKVKRVFVWKQDRVVSGVKLWFHILYQFEQTGTKLIDVLTGRDLAADDSATEITTAVTARGDREFQTKLADNVLRARVELAKEGMPQSKLAPFGFDKMYTDKAGRHLWTLHTVTTGGKDQTQYLVIMPDGSRHERTKAPRKSKDDRIKYITTIATDRIETVKYVFNTFATESITTSSLAQRLNALGKYHYGKAWLRTTIEDILRNPVYVGAVRNNHTSQAEFSKYDGKKITKADNKDRKTVRNPEEAVILVRDKHEAIVDTTLWETVQKKLNDRKKRVQPPRRDDLWLRGVLYCSKCDRPMHIFSSKTKGVKGYICGSYYRFNQTRSQADFTGCTRNWITHERAEALVNTRVSQSLDKLKNSSEMEALADVVSRQPGGYEIRTIITKGVTEYLRNLLPLFGEADSPTRLAELLSRATNRTIKDKRLAEEIDKYADEFLTVDQVRKLFIVFEEEKVKLVEAKLRELESEYTLWQKAKAKAETERETERANRRLRELDTELTQWEAQRVPLDDQLADVRTKLAEHFRQLREAIQTIKSGTTRRKAEVVRGLFEKVVLHFEPVQKAKITDCVFRPEKTEFVANVSDGSALPALRASSPGGPGSPSSAGSR